MRSNYNFAIHFHPPKDTTLFESKNEKLTSTFTSLPSSFLYKFGAEKTSSDLLKTSDVKVDTYSKHFYVISGGRCGDHGPWSLGHCSRAALYQYCTHRIPHSVKLPKSLTCKLNYACFKTWHWNITTVILLHHTFKGLTIIVNENLKHIFFN